MVLSSEFIDRVKRHEGLRLMAYMDTTGNLTVGYGHKLPMPEITKEEAETFLMSDLNNAFRWVKTIYPNWDEIDNKRQEVLIELCFNLGANGLRGFRMMNRAITNYDWPAAAEELKASKWYKQVGTRGTELVNLLLNG